MSTLKVDSVGLEVDSVGFKDKCFPGTMSVNTQTMLCDEGGAAAMVDIVSGNRYSRYS